MYINGDLNRKKELLSRWLDETWDKDVIIGGDVYARTGSLGGFKAVGVGIEGNSRKSKDKVINKDGKDLPPQKKGWGIMNGCTVEDEEGEWTFIGERGCSVIDVVLGNERSRNRIQELKVIERTESDHLPVVVQVKSTGRKSTKKDEDEMKGLMRTLERYVEKKKLEVNVSKTKVMRCRKGDGRKRKVFWNWRGKEVEEVDRYLYLGYVVRANEQQDAHIRERVAKGAKIMGQVWGIGKGKFGKDWARRVWLFDKLVWPVMSYGVEIWGWKAREELEKIHDKYLRWVLGVSRNVAGYLIREELKRDRLEGKAGIRAWKYEKRIEEGGGGEIVRRCRQEMKKRVLAGREFFGWEEERKEYFEKRGWCLTEVERKWENGSMRGKDLMYIERRKQEKERWERIVVSESNREYRFINVKGIPGYLKKGW
ncbi:GSCOCG00012420001-RA-CDS, partial [Cotesia congregata]